MITTKADKLLRSLIDAGLLLTDFTLLATKVMRIQRDFKINNEDRRQRDRSRQQDKIREQNRLEQQIKDEEQRKKKGLEKLRELGYVIDDDTHSISNNNNPTDISDQQFLNSIENKDKKIKTDQLLLPYSKQINDMKQKQRDCCLTFNIDYDLRINQQALERACRRAKRNIYELRAERFNHPEHRSVLSVETATLHNKLKEIIRGINKIFLDPKSNQEKRYLQELLIYINQYEGDIDLLMCQMQYEPKVKETILFAPVTTDILDRMNLILYYVRTLANRISNDDYIDENIEETTSDLSNLPSKVAYIIKIKTNDDKSSSLSDETNVTIKFYGTNNKSPDIRLLQSINKTKWQPGQIDLFNIELNYLADIYALEIWHDSQYSSWKVDWIEIIDDAANMYRFPIDRLFDKHSNEKKTRFIVQRDIGPVNRLPSKPLKQIKTYKQIGFSTYTVQVKTGKQLNKATDSSVFIQLKGENGSFADNLCSANSAFKGSVFEPDQLDTFYLVWPKLAKLNSLHLLIQSEGVNPAWFCEYITIEDSQSGDQYKFIVNQLFDGSNPDDPNLTKHLTVYPENTNQENKKEGEEKKPGYLMKIKTGEKGLSNMSTLPPINLLLKGEKGKSDLYTLKHLDNKRKLFRENQTDEFILSSKYYVGPIKALQLSSNDQTDKWFIETIIIRDIAQGQDYIFPIYQWINQQDGANNLIAQPINERKAAYIVYTRTIASELTGPDRTIKLLMQGNKGKHEIELDNPVSMHNTFQPGHKDEYYIENMNSLGDLQSIQLDITHPNIKKLGLDYIEIKDCTTNNSYRFNVNRMLDSKNPKMTAKAELIPRSNAPSTKNPSSSKINRNPSNQLTLPNVGGTLSNKKNFDQLTTNVPQGAKRPMNDTSETDLYEKDHQDTSSMNLPDVNKKIGDKNEINSEKNVYKIKIKTINKEFINKDIKLQLELIDDNGQSEMMILDRTDNNTVGLETDKIDIFTTDATNDLGRLKNLKLSLIGSKLKQKNVYQPDFIEISNPKSNKTYRIQYTKDDLLNADKNRLEIIKPLKLLSDINIREKAQPQGSALSTTTSKSNNLPTPYKKLADSILSENDDEDLSLPNNTITSSTSQDISKGNSSLSEKLNSSSSRQIRPGDRVKNSSKRQLIDHRSNPSSLHEADWYHRSIETNKDLRNEAKQIQLISNKHISQTKFDQQQAQIIKNNKESNLDENYTKKINSLPRKSSSRSLKQQKNTKINEIPNRSPPPNVYEENQQDRIFSAQQLPINQKINNNRDMRENYSPTVANQQNIKDRTRKADQVQNIASSTTAGSSLTNQNITSKTGSSFSKQTSQSSSSSIPAWPVDQKNVSLIKHKNNIDDPTETMVIIDSPTPSNLSELTNYNNKTTSNKSSVTTHEQSKTSTQLPQKQASYDRTPLGSNVVDTSSMTIQSRDKINDLLLTNKQRAETKLTTSIVSTPFKNDQKTVISNSPSPLSIPSKSVPPNSRSPSDVTTRRSLSVSSSRTPSNRDKQLSNVSSTISKDQSQQPVNITSSLNTDVPSQTTNPSTTASHLSQLTSKNSIQTQNELSSTPTPNKTFSVSTTHNEITSQNNLKKSPQTSDIIIDPNFNNYNIQPNAQGVSTVSIHTIATKSDSDSSVTRKSNDSHGSEHSVQNKLLLSPDVAKKGRKNRRRKHRLNEQASTSEPSVITPDLSSSHTSSANGKYLSQETSDIQYASPPPSSKSPSDNAPLAIELIPSNRKPQASQDKLSTQSHSYTDEETKSKETNIASREKSTTSKPSLNASKTTGISSISTTTTQSHILPKETSDIQSSTTSKNQTITSKTSSNLPVKATGMDHMSTVYEVSEPSTTSISNMFASSLSEHDVNQENLQDWLDTSSNTSSSEQNTSKPKSLSNQTNNSIEYEFRIQIGNESQLDGTNEPILIELINTKERSIKFPLIDSINNPKPFQKGQLDLFHINIPNNFIPINKFNISLPKTNKDPVHIRYCELQDRRTMNTLYFPIEKWLGEKNIYNVEMYINNSS